MIMDTRAILKEKVTEFSPELQRLKKVDLLITDTSDGMSDLHEREITATALYRAFDKHIIPIPATISLLDHIRTLRVSRDRAGRKEYVSAVKGHPNYTVNPYNFEEQNKQPGFFARIAGFFRRKPAQE